MCFDIFSSFDSMNGSVSIFIGWLWVVPFLIMFLLFVSFWVNMSMKSSFNYNLMLIVFNLVKRSYSSNLSGVSLMVVSLFFMLIVFNLSGLIPYVFSVTSHLAITLCFSLPLWFSLIFSGIFFSWQKVLSHLVIYGSPEVLMSFLVLVETISISIRPITLSVRLTANMSAGHVVVGLLAGALISYFFFFSLIVMVFVVMIGIFYFMFEFGVSLIQSYVFSLLYVLYSDDHPN